MIAIKEIKEDMVLASIGSFYGAPALHASFSMAPAYSRMRARAQGAKSA
jgi:hypothetical protein